MSFGQWELKEIDGRKYLEFTTELPFRVVFTCKQGRAFLDTLGIRNIAHLKQIHSAKIYQVDAPVDGELEGDGLVSSRSGLFLAVKVADCYPIFLMDPERMAFGAVHAGWRGSVKGIAAKAVETMRDRFGSDPKDIHVAIGPGICGRCYRVGEDVAKLFDHGVAIRDGDFYLDLVEYNRHRLVEVGVKPENIVDSGLCTYERADLLNSYRREGRVQNMWGAIGLASR